MWNLTTRGGASRLLGCILADSVTGYKSSLWPGGLLSDDLQPPLGGILYFCLTPAFLEAPLLGPCLFLAAHCSTGLGTVCGGCGVGAGGWVGIKGS